MLSFLSIRNTAIIDDLTVEFAPGMNCISGETGAGKSIIIDSVCYLLGDKMSKDIIRRGSSSSEITGVFNTDPQDARISAVLSELGIDPEEDGTVVIYRAFSDQSRNVCRINDRIVTVSALKRLGEALVDVYGQHDSHSLLSAQNHINYLDAFAGPGFENALAAYRVKLSEHKKTLELIDELNVDPMKRAQLIDLLTFQVGEIEGASLRSGEDDELEAKQKLIDNAEKIRDSLAFALEMLDGSGGYDQQSGAMTELDNAAAKLSSIEKFSPEFGELASKLKEAYYILEDVRDTLSDDTDEYSFDEGEARRTEQRIDLIYDLKRKYGKTVNDIIAFGADARERLDKLLDSEETARKLLKKSEEEIAELRKYVLVLRDFRVKAAKVLTDGVVKALADIEMNKVRFAVEFRDFDGEKPDFKENGLDGAEFLISTNPGEAPKPLGRIASGGELSRIMLAIKSCLADADMIPILIFDEIDTGISGSAAAAVAEKFYSVSRSHQLICVTHLAPIAAIADRNIHIDKKTDDDSVRTNAEILDNEGKIKEVGRLLDGSAAAEGVTRAHSIELIERMKNRALSSK